MSEQTVHVARQGKVLGVMPMKEAVARLASGEFRPVDHYWMPGMAEWRALSELAPAQRKPHGKQSGHAPPPWEPEPHGHEARESAVQRSARTRTRTRRS